MENKKTYSEKLRDPRWQKLRLRILERDYFSCVSCGDDSSTLNVHHIDYSPGDPWETPENLLVTLCEDCHKKESENLAGNIKGLIKQMKTSGCMSGDFQKLTEIFSDLKPDFFRFDPNLDILHHFLNNEELWKMAHQSYFNYLSSIREKNRELLAEDPNFPF